MLVLPFVSRGLAARLWASALALLVIFAAKGLQAASSVPMCGESAQTVVAPPAMRATAEGMLRAGSCEDRGARGVQGTLPERPTERSMSLDSVHRLPPVGYRMPPAPAHLRTFIEFAHSGELSGYRAVIERPPR